MFFLLFRPPPLSTCTCPLFPSATLFRSDLRDRWQLSLAQDAPNRFIINVQSDQVQPVRDFIAAQGLTAPTLVPMVRSRLLERNGKPVRGDAVADRVEADGGDARQDSEESR